MLVPTRRRHKHREHGRATPPPPACAVPRPALRVAARWLDSGSAVTAAWRNGGSAPRHRRSWCVSQPVEGEAGAVAVAEAAASSSGSDCGFWSWWCLLFWASIYIRRNSKTRKYSAVPGLGPSSVQTRCEPGRVWGQARASWARTLGEHGASLGVSSEQARGRGIHANASTGTCTAERS